MVLGSGFRASGDEFIGDGILPCFIRKLVGFRVHMARVGPQLLLGVMW